MIESAELRKSIACFMLGPWSANRLNRPILLAQTLHRTVPSTRTSLPLSHWSQNSPMIRSMPSHSASRPASVTSIPSQQPSKPRHLASRSTPPMSASCLSTGSHQKLSYPRSAGPSPPVGRAGPGHPGLESSVCAPRPARAYIPPLPSELREKTFAGVPSVVGAGCAHRESKLGRKGDRRFSDAPASRHRRLRDTRTTTHDGRTPGQVRQNAQRNTYLLSRSAFGTGELARWAYG